MVVTCRNRSSTTITVRWCRPAVGGWAPPNTIAALRRSRPPAGGLKTPPKAAILLRTAPPTAVQAALRFIFHCVSPKSCLFCNYRETTLLTYRRVWSGFAFFGHSPLPNRDRVWSVFVFFGHSPLPNDEQVWSGFVFFGHSPLQNKEPAYGRRFKNSPKATPL